MGAVGASHLGMGPELACFETGRHGFSTADISDALLAHWHTGLGIGPLGHEGAFSNSQTVLARIVGAGHFQHVHLARFDHLGGAVFDQWQVGHFGLHHAHLLSPDWRIDLPQPTV